MTRLMASDTHGNDISVFYDDVDNIYYKVSSTVKGVSLLRNEKTGWDWYAANLLKKNAMVNLHLISEEYARLEIEAFTGNKYSYRDNFLNNYKVINHVAEFYCINWPREKQTPVHGDLTLDNILLDNKDIYIIDWENHVSTPVFWGYDLVYLILSALLLPHDTFCLPNKAELKKLGQLFLRLKKEGIDEKILETPLYNIRDCIETKLLCSGLGFPRSKFFPLRYSELEIDIFDECLVRAYRYAVYDEYIASKGDMACIES